MAQPEEQRFTYDIERITREALALPEELRVRLAQRLWATLPGYVPADVGPEQLDELFRRVDAIDRGEMEFVPAEDVIRELREKYGRT